MVMLKMDTKSHLITRAGRLAPHIRALGRTQKGVAALEFLLVLPVFMSFILLGVDFSMMGYQYVSVSNAVREGARFGAVNCDDGTCSANDVRDRAVNRSSGVLANSEVTVGWKDVSLPSGNLDRGDSAVVHACHLYEFMFIPFTFKMPVVSRAEMTLEQTDLASSLPTYPNNDPTCSADNGDDDDGDDDDEGDDDEGDDDEGDDEGDDDN